MDIPARGSACLLASTGPRPMISGDRAVTPVETMRASGVRPSSRALVSDMMTRAAAPSLSGQQLPAVTVPSGRKTGLSASTASSVTPARGPSSAVTTVPSGSVTGVISRCPEAFGDRLLGEVLRAHAELVHVAAGHALDLGQVLGGLAHRDVDVGDLAAFAGVGPGVRAGLGRACAVRASALLNTGFVVFGHESELPRA